MQQQGGINPAGLAEAAALMQQYKIGSTAPNLFQIPDHGVPGGTEASKFPVQIGSTDPDDGKYQMREKIVQGPNAIVPGIGQAIAGEEFFDYAARKEEQAQLLQFTQWVMQQADLSKPESAAWWFEKFPWMKSLRLAEIDKQAELQKRLARIAIQGPQDQGDFLTLWMKQQGLIKVSDKPLHKINEDETIVADNYVKGFFAPWSKQPPAQGFARDHAVVPWKNPLSGVLDWTEAGGGIPPTSFPGSRNPGGVVTTDWSRLWRGPQ